MDALLKKTEDQLQGIRATLRSNGGKMTPQQKGLYEALIAVKQNLEEQLPKKGGK